MIKGEITLYTANKWGDWGNIAYSYTLQYEPETREYPSYLDINILNYVDIDGDPVDWIDDECIENIKEKIAMLFYDDNL